jgi:hypothetical protein
MEKINIVVIKSINTLPIEKLLDEDVGVLRKEGSIIRNKQ